MRAIVAILLFAVSLSAVDYMDTYNRAVDLIREGEPAKARGLFRQVSQGPEDLGLRDNAEYWIAVSYFDEGEYSRAIAHYRRAQVLPDGNKAEAAQYEMAVARLESGDSVGAAFEFFKFKNLYPGSGLITRVDEKLAMLGEPLLAAKAETSKPPKTEESSPKTSGLTPVQAGPKETPEAKPSKKEDEKPKSGMTPVGSESSESKSEKAGEPEESPKKEPAKPKSGLSPAGESPETEKSPEPGQPSPEPGEKPGKPAESESGEEPKTGTTPEPSARAKPARSPEESTEKPAGSREENADTTGPRSLGPRMDQVESSKIDNIETLPVDADPRLLIKPEDKRGF